MSIRRTAALALAAAAVLATAAPATAAPATGRVVAFVADLIPVTVFENPSGCHQLPLGSHVVFNETDGPIEVFADPFCTMPLEPLARLAAGRSMHVSMAGSFRA